MVTRPRVVFYGLGTIGRGALKLALETGAVQVVGGVDPRKDMIGKDLGELVDMKKIGVTVSPTLAESLDGKDADAAIHTTESRVVLVAKQIRELVFPYAFPDTGHYNVFVQVRQEGRIHTTAFRVNVRR